MQRLQRQMEFLLELDKLKTIVRRNHLADGSRRENDAEHSWYIAVGAMVLAEHAAAAVDVDRVVRMALVRDVVEIDAGDTLSYDESAKRDQEERDRRAADRLFGCCPRTRHGTSWRSSVSSRNARPRRLAMRELSTVSWP